MKKAFPVLAILTVGMLLLYRPDAVSLAVQNGLQLCFGTVIPSLFPFFVVVSLLLQLGLADSLHGICAPLMRPLFHMRGICALPLLAGLLGGYPTGAKTTAELYHQGQITRQEAELLLGFCDNCGPAFILGYIGAGVLRNQQAGIWLFAIHITAALISGAVLSRLEKNRGPGMIRDTLPVKRTSFPAALTGSVSGALASTLNICAFVVLFRVLAALMPAQIPGAFLGCLEMVTGIAALEPGQTGFIAAAAIVGWGGLSVHCQAMSVTEPEGLSFRWHWVGKAVQAGVSVLLAAAAAALMG